MPGLPGSEPFLPGIPSKAARNARLPWPGSLPPCLEFGLLCLESRFCCPESRLFCREFRAFCLEFRAVLSTISSLLFRIPICSVENWSELKCCLSFQAALSRNSRIPELGSRAHYRPLLQPRKHHPHAIPQHPPHLAVATRQMAPGWTNTRLQQKNQPPL